jgi:hypothetical protein
MNTDTFNISSIPMQLIAGLILLAGFSCPSVAATYMVAAGESFTLKKGESAQLKNTDVVLKVISFVNSPCPKNAQCIWSGLAVNHELTIAGKPYKDYDSHYNVNLIGSDYTSYATYTITNADDQCATRGDGCWDEMMRRFKDASYCYKMKDPVGKGYCLENIKKINGE